MLMWHLAFAALVAASAVGMVLFFGYTFRVRLAYPLILVTVHLILSLVATVLFVMAAMQSLFYNKHHSTLYDVLLVTSIVVMILTVLVGLAFYFRFNLGRIDIHGRFIGLHVTMASVAFILVVASTIGLTQTYDSKILPIHPSLYNFYKHHRHLNQH